MTDEQAKAHNQARDAADRILRKATGLSLGAVRQMPPAERDKILAEVQAIAEVVE